MRAAFLRSVTVFAPMYSTLLACGTRLRACSIIACTGATSIMPVTLRYGKPYSSTVQLTPQNTIGRSESR